MYHIPPFYVLIVIRIKIDWGANFHHYEEYLTKNGSDLISLTKENVAEKIESDIKVRVSTTNSNGDASSMEHHTFDMVRESISLVGSGPEPPKKFGPTKDRVFG